MKKNPIVKEETPAGLNKILLSHLIPDAKNPRKDLKKGDPEFEKIQNSIGKFGQLDPIIYNTRTRKVIGGHQRLKVLDSKGYTELYTVTLGAYTWAFAEADLKELSEKEESAANIALNKAQGDWNIDQLMINLQEIKADGMLEFTGFDEKEFTGLLRELHKDDVPLDTEPQISRAEELRKEWGTELGQMWQCGEHRVICGDCTDPAVVQRVMGGEKADIILTDPPYGVDIVPKAGRSKGKIGASNLAKCKTYQPIEGDDKPFNPTFLLELSKDQIIFGGNYFAEKLPSSPCWIVWDKREGMTSNSFADCELAWSSFDKPARVYHHLWSGMIRKGDHNIEGKERSHPTQKPVGLFSDILKDFSEDNQTIVDPFLGSGTTMIACENLGRKCRGCEIDPGYLGVILERYKTTFPDKEIRLMGDK